MSQSQHDPPLDLPDYSQDTLNILPRVVRENQLGRSARHHPHRLHSGAPEPSRSSDPGQPIMNSSAIVRASLWSAIANAPPLTNPFLSAPRNDSERSVPSATTTRIPNASESFQDMDVALDSQDDNPISQLALGNPALHDGNGNIPEMANLLPPAVRTMSASTPRDRSVYVQQAKSLKLLLVSGQQSGGKSLYFDIHEVAGRGSFSEVSRATHRMDGCVYALKKNIAPLQTDKARMDSLQEIFALSSLQGHPNILRYHDAWFEEKGRFLVIQTEYLASGNLHSLFTEKKMRMPVSELRQLATDLSSALAFMHKRDIAHLDVKPDNIFKAHRGMGRSVYVIGDFGLACHKEGNDARSTEGDSRYLCPEALACAPGENDTGHGMDQMHGDAENIDMYMSDDEHEVERAQYGTGADLRAGDVFSLGATLYELALGRPLDKSGPQWHRLRMQPDEVAREIEDVCENHNVANIVRRMIEPDPRLRASAVEIVQLCQEADPEYIRQKDNEEFLRRELKAALDRVGRFEHVMKRLLASGEEGRNRWQKVNGVQDFTSGRGL